MADQRPAFRFRLPWLPAAQPPRPTFPPRPPAQPTAATTPSQTTPQTTATQAPPQPSVTITPPPTTPQTTATQTPPQPTISTTPPTTMPQTAETQIPSQPSTTISAPTTQTAERAALTQPTITTRPTQTPTPRTPERLPFRPPGVAPAQGPPPQSQTSRTESQPSSPSRAITQPRVPSQPASPSRVASQSRAPSQPLTPPRAAPQQRAASLPSSPSRRSTQLPSTPQTATQPRSPSLASIQVGQTSSPPPSSTTAQRQPTTAAATQLTSPPKTEQSTTQKSSQSSASSAEVVSPPSDKQESKSASESPPLELQPKTAVPEDNIHDSQDRAPIKTSVHPSEMAQQPSKESGMRAAEVFTTTEGPETPAVTQISTTSTINGKPESPFSKEMKPEEPKEVKEVMQDIKDKAHDRARHTDGDLKGELGQTLQTKDLSSIPFQSEQAQKTIARKETIATSASHGKQTKIPTAHPRNKTVLADSQQKHGNSSGDNMPLHKEIRDDISKLVNKMAIRDSKHSIDDGPVSVITLAGENRGASMHVGFDSSKKEEAIHIRRGYKIKPDDSAEATTDGEESFKGQSDNPNAKEDQASEAYVNSNVQGVNNSILFNTSITERNPGVHLIHSRFSTESKKPSRKPELIETRKAEFNMTPSQKLTHEPTVRRRCLRGLFLESSDSDLDAAKPRRHGCHVGCTEKSKENNIDVL